MLVLWVKAARRVKDAGVGREVRVVPYPLL